MSQYGAAFVRPSSEPKSAFDTICRMISDRNVAWLAASPEHMTSDCTVRVHDGTPWLSIDNIGQDSLREIARDLSSEAMTFYVNDEHHLEFHYLHLRGGNLLRALDYSDRETPKGMGQWKHVEGESEAWEALLFSPKAMEAYEKYGLAQEVAEVRRQPAIRVGASIPWACDGKTIAQIAEYLQLPWDPWHDAFGVATHSAVIPGNPERQQAFLRGLRQSWWRFW